MIINRIHLGSVVFAKTLAASLAAGSRRLPLPAAARASNTEYRRQPNESASTTRRSKRRQWPQAPGACPIRVRSTAEIK
jgi:hypothetical protein